MLTFTGAASFLDYEHNQTLTADTLKVWLKPGSNGSTAMPAPSSVAKSPNNEKLPRPEHLDAKGNVTAHSAEMNIHDTGRLIVWFKDIPGEPKLAAAVAAIGPVKPNRAVGMPASFTRALPAGPEALAAAPPAPAPVGITMPGPNGPAARPANAGARRLPICRTASAA